MNQITFTVTLLKFLHMLERTELAKIFADVNERLEEAGPLMYGGTISLIEALNILARRNHNSGKLETGIPDAGNQLNSA